MAETEGFEPSMELLTPYSLSRGAPSASRASLREAKSRAAKDTERAPIRQTSPPSAGVAALFRRAGGIAALDALVDLLAMDGHVLGGGDADPHLVALHAEHGHGDRITDHQCFAYPAGQDQHRNSRVAVVVGRMGATTQGMHPIHRIIRGIVQLPQARRSWSPHSGPELALHPGGHAVERGHQGRTVLAAALRHVGAPAALAVGLARDVAEHVAGLDPAERRATDACHQRGLAAVRAGQNDHRIAQLLLEP